ncbi:MAG: hypothetical protein MZV64_19910 [Ignavibacteriales bacterium]|nr:hypothetical protein [Ignavibacteriales bacterium]
MAISEKSGIRSSRLKQPTSTFLIGRNPNPTEERPYKYVPVRHVPVSTTMLPVLRRQPPAELQCPAHLGVCDAAQHPEEHAAERLLPVMSRQRRRPSS